MDYYEGLDGSPCRELSFDNGMFENKIGSHRTNSSTRASMSSDWVVTNNNNSSSSSSSQVQTNSNMQIFGSESQSDQNLNGSLNGGFNQDYPLVGSDQNPFGFVNGGFSQGYQDYSPMTSQLAYNSQQNLNFSSGSSLSMNL